MIALDRPVVTRVSLTMGPGEIKGAAPRPHTSPDVSTRENHTLLWSQLSHQHQDTGNYGSGQGHYYNNLSLTRSGDINAALRVDHDWAWLETTCLLRPGLSCEC